MKVYTVGLVFAPRRFSGIWSMTDIQHEIMLMLAEHWGTPIMRSELMVGGGYAPGKEWGEFATALHDLIQAGYVSEVTLVNSEHKETFFGYVDTSSVTRDHKTGVRSIPCVMRTEGCIWGSK